LFKKNSLYEFRSALFVQLLHYFGFTIQLVMLCVFNVKVKNLAFDTSKCQVFYEKLPETTVRVLFLQ